MYLSFRLDARICPNYCTGSECNLSIWSDDCPQKLGAPHHGMDKFKLLGTASGMLQTAPISCSIQPLLLESLLLWLGLISVTTPYLSNNIPVVILCSFGPTVPSHPSRLCAGVIIPTEYLSRHPVLKANFIASVICPNSPLSGYLMKVSLQVIFFFFYLMCVCLSLHRLEIETVLASKAEQ